MSSRILLTGLSVWLILVHTSYWWMHQLFASAERSVVSVSLCGALVALAATLWAQLNPYASEYAHIRNRMPRSHDYLMVSIVCIAVLLPAAVAVTFYRSADIRQAVFARRLFVPFDLQAQLAHREWAGFLKLMVWGIPLILVYPVLEEFLYRGLFWGWARNRLGPWPARILVTVVFALQHDVFTGSLATAWSRIVQYSIWGAIFLIVTEWKNSIHPAILVHMACNLSGWLIGTRPYWF